VVSTNGLAAALTRAAGGGCNSDMDEAHSNGRTLLPLACTLGADDGAAQLDRWRALAARGRPVARRDGHRLEVRFESVPGMVDELRALVATEQQSPTRTPPQSCAWRRHPARPTT
jgi:hypothetical protein